MKNKGFFRSFVTFIDRKIVFPITKLVLAISEKFSKSGKVIEHWLSKSNTLLFISLLFAIILYIAVDQRLITMNESSAEVLRDVPVIAEYNQESYVIEGLPDKVDITLIGGKSDLYFAKQSGTKNIVVDLSDLKPGTHKVQINYTKEFSSIDYSVNPSTATIIIHQKESATKNITYDLLNQDKLDVKKVIDGVTLSTSEVIVKGAEYQINKVAIVKALIDVSKLSTQDVGTQTIDNIKLIAYDEKGDIVDVEIVPEVVSAEIRIKSPSKELPLKFVTKGSVAFGYAIKTIEASDTKVTVWGSNEAINDLKFIEVDVNVSDLKANQKYKLEINKPSGVRAMSISTVNVDITLDTASDRELDNVGLIWRNLDLSKYKVQASSASDTNVTIILKGVSSVINSIQANDVTAYLDLSGYSEGEYEVDVQVEGNDTRVEYVAKTKKVKVKITKIG